MSEWVNVFSGEMVGKKGVPLRSWKRLKNGRAKAAGTMKVKALVRRLEKKEQS